MSLYGRLLRLEEPNIAVHTLLAVLAELQRGQMTRSQVDAFLVLSASEIVELTSFLSTYFTGNLVTRLQAALALHDVLLIGNHHRGIYDTEVTLRARLGV